MIGGNNGLIVPVALGSDGVNTLITIDIDDDIVYGIDVATGITSAIGPIGYDANFGQGLTFDYATDQLLNTAYNGALGDSELRVINTNTGLSTSLGIIRPGTTTQYGWAGSYDKDILGIANATEQRLQFYPNPVKDRLLFVNEVPIEFMEVITQAGQSILRIEPGTLNGEIDTSGWSTGLYFINSHVDGTVFHDKIIKE